MSVAKESRSIIEYGRLLYQKRMIAGYDGNLSVKIGQNRLLVTPAGFPKGFLKPADLVITDLAGKVVSGRQKPSSELAMHLEVYKNRPDIGACCHAHPPFATAFAAANKNLPENILPEIILFVGKIALAEYIPTGVASKWAKLAKYIKNANAVLLKNHGLLTLGKDLKEAYFRMEAVEHFAQIAFYGKDLGGLKHLDKQELIRLKKLGGTFSK